jgi:hypothetical protein
MINDCWWNNNKRKCESKDASYKKSKHPEKKDKYNESNYAEDEEEQSAMFIADAFANLSYNEEDTIIESVQASIAEDKNTTDTINNPSINEEELPVLYKASDVEDTVSFASNDYMLPLYIECLMDIGTTSHIFNDRNLFSDYRPIENIYIGRVGDIKT